VLGVVFFLGIIACIIVYAVLCHKEGNQQQGQQKHLILKRNVISNSPILHVIENFLSPEEADQVIALAQGRFKPSEVVPEGNAGDQVVESARTSTSVYLVKSENPLIKSIEERAAKEANLPTSHLERLQVVRYEHGQFYKPHFDYLPVNYDTMTNGQRAVTIFVYLNTLPTEETGGGTHFPELNVTLKPKQGHAGFWHNMVNGKEDPRVLHGGETIAHPSTVKYGLNIWFRDRPQRQ
jgi:prolyl 4-hydroxylase